MTNNTFETSTKGNLIMPKAVFENLTFNEFNNRYQLQAQEEMSIEEFTNHVESNDLSYFYASYNEDDVQNAVKEEWDVAQHMKLSFLCVEGLCIAVY